MGKNSDRLKISSGFIWNAVEKFLLTIGQVITGIVLARVLDPKDFGLIGMLSIFIVITQVFVDSGMSAALIQKQDKRKEDYSTVFIFNLTVSLFLYCILFLSAPQIAVFYGEPQLINLTRVLSFVLIINSFNIVQRSILEADINFKKLAIINTTSLTCASIVSISLALYGFGVWALVTQLMIIPFISTVLLWFSSPWKISIKFSYERFKILFNYGSKILFTSLYSAALQEMYTVAIGKVYNATKLGYFVQARKLLDLSEGSLTVVIKKVAFPVLSKLQDKEENLIDTHRKLVGLISCVILPIMVFIAISAEDIVYVLLGEKWSPIIVLIQWFCFSRIFYPINTLNMELLNAIGRSDLYLKINLLKFPLIITVFIITISISLEAVVIGLFINSSVSFFINSYYTGKFYNFNGWQQLVSIRKILLVTILYSCILMVTQYLIVDHLAYLASSMLLGLGGYILLSKMMKIEEMDYLLSILKKYRNKL